jgi:hypothetical protein
VKLIDRLTLNEIEDLVAAMNWEEQPHGTGWEVGDHYGPTQPDGCRQCLPVRLQMFLWDENLKDFEL